MPSFSMYGGTPQGQCRNCGQVHNTLRDCCFITIRRSGRAKLCLFDQVQSIIVPKSAEERRRLRDFIWEEFESIKVENDMDREVLTERHSPKGSLREKAPIPWLCWTAVDGRSGQTRNKANFDLFWRTTIESAANRGPLVLTSVFLPEPTEFIQQ